MIEFNFQTLPSVSRDFLKSDSVSLSLLSVNNRKIISMIDQFKDIVDYFHIDLMDGEFVHPYNFVSYEGDPHDKSDFPFVSSLLIKRVKEKFPDLKLDAHLMASKPAPYIIEYALAGVDVLTFHIETDTEKTTDNISLIHSLGKLAGLAINPKTPIEKLYPYLAEIDLVLIMSVEPGAGGQKFIEESTGRIKQLSKYIKENNLDVKIQVDGGINHYSGPLAIESGADIVVSGSFLVTHSDPEAGVKSLLKY
jgi:ribulose-phosphate 3-epimerase